jgi:hypothetical protein
MRSTGRSFRFGGGILKAEDTREKRLMRKARFKLNCAIGDPIRGQLSQDFVQPQRISK